MTRRITVRSIGKVWHETPPSRRVAILRLAYFRWMLWLGAMGTAVAVVGLPHLRWQYEYTMRGGQPHYSRCDYVGPLGVFTRRPSDGDCGLVEWKSPWGPVDVRQVLNMQGSVQRR